MRSGTLTVDIHGMNQYQAKIRLDSALRRADTSVYQVVVIHGFHGGDALREMVRADYLSHPRVLRIIKDEDGRTTLVLRELF